MEMLTAKMSQHKSSNKCASDYGLEVLTALRWTEAGAGTNTSALGWSSGEGRVGYESVAVTTLGLQIRDMLKQYRNEYSSKCIRACS